MYGNLRLIYVPLLVHLESFTPPRLARLHARSLLIRRNSARVNVLVASEAILDETEDAGRSVLSERKPFLMGLNRRV